MFQDVAALFFKGYCSDGSAHRNKEPRLQLRTSLYESNVLKDGAVDDSECR